jgi:hypothetical protein
MRKPVSERYRYALLVSILLMICCLFISRAFLSMSMILFFAITLFKKGIIKQVRTAFTDPLYLSMMILFLIPLLSGMWSNDHQKWFDVVRIKLPLLLFPIAFAFNWPLLEKDWKNIAMVFIVVLFVAVSWSFLNYLYHADLFNKAYLRAKLIDTPFDNDHVRFSWTVLIGVIVSSILWMESSRKVQKMIALFLILYLVLYLHLLAARTGLVCLYLIAIAGIIYLLLYKPKRKWAFALLLLLFIAGITSWLLFPTLQNRYSYFKYDISTVKSKQYVPGSNDGSRVLSLKAGWYVLQQHPFGVGAGDIMHETGKWYNAKVANIVESDKFYPCSEWVTYGMFAGWPGVFLFTAIMMVPFLIKIERYPFIWKLLNGTAAFSFIFDIGLEAQYGAFVYPFIILCFYKWINYKRIL